MTDYPDLAELHRSSNHRTTGQTHPSVRVQWQRPGCTHKNKRLTPPYVRHAHGNQINTIDPGISTNSAGNKYTCQKETRSLQTLQASSPPFFDLRLRERRFDPRLFALRLAERLAFLLPPFFAAAFLREERLFGAMVQTTRNYGCNTTASN